MLQLLIFHLDTEGQAGPCSRVGHASSLLGRAWKQASGQGTPSSPPPWGPGDKPTASEGEKQDLPHFLSMKQRSKGWEMARRWGLPRDCRGGRDREDSGQPRASKL